MKILITGANGFIGDYLLDICKKNTAYSEIYTVARGPFPIEEGTKHKLHICADLAVQSEVEYMFSRIKPDIIFHLAGYPVVKVNEYHINEAIYGNVITTHNLTHFCPEGCTFVLASTVLVYGDLNQTDYWNESYIDEGAITIPTSVYGVSKLAAEELVLMHHWRGKLKAKIARMCANVGISATHGVLRDFIRKAKSDEEYFEILGDKPGSRKPYMYAYDTAMALVYMAFLYNGIVYNVSPDDSLTSEEIAEIVQEECGTNKPIKWMGEQANWVGDNKKLLIDGSWLRDQGYEPQCKTSDEAIRQAIRNSI